MIAPVMLGILLLLVVSYTWYQNIATRRLYNFSWNDLLGKLEPVPKVTVAQVGNEYLNPGPNQLGLEPADIWLGLGGLEGLRRMRRNARILIALATYAEPWNFTESVIVRERMRQDARHLERAALQIRMRMMLHMGQVRIVFHLYDSVAAYHLMTKRLLALYCSSHAGLYPRLAQALSENPSQYISAPQAEI